MELMDDGWNPIWSHAEGNIKMTYNQISMSGDKKIVV